MWDATCAAWRSGIAWCSIRGTTAPARGRAPLCEYCATGDTHQCEHYREHGITGLPGGLADAMVVPAVNVVRVASGLVSTEAVLTEPLACIVHAVDAAMRAHSRYRLDGPAASRAQTVLVTGAGPAGLLFVQYLRNVIGFEGRLIVSEPEPGKRALAAGFGADVIDPSGGGFVDAVLERTSSRRADWVIDASGSARILLDLPGVMRKQATVVLYGHGHAGVDISLISNIQFKEPTLITPVGASGGLDGDGRPTVYRRALSCSRKGACGWRRSSRIVTALSTPCPPLLPARIAPPATSRASSSSGRKRGGAAKGRALLHGIQQGGRGL